uniref:Integrase catalytic domain-containing protein n=1 Tax=Strongyloides venezuelensis TaxID=75913 RepID=A0A0K0F4E6_STRVS
MTTTLNSINTSEISIKLRDDILFKFGLPEVLKTDSAAYWSSNEFSYFIKNLGIRHRLGTPYNHRSSSLAERSFRSIEELIAKNLGPLNWDSYLPYICFIYNHWPQKQLLSRTPAELFLADMSIPEFESESLVDCLSSQQNTEQLRILELLHEIALKKWSEFPNDETVCKTGDKILIRTISRENKFMPRYTGPYTVISATPYMIQYRKSEKSRKVSRAHPQHVKLFEVQGEK